jgi:hypothetical protein
MARYEPDIKRYLGYITGNAEIDSVLAKARNESFWNFVIHKLTGKISDKKL